MTDLQVKTIRQLLDGVDLESNLTTWGCWKYHPENLTLECRDERGFIYEIDLERCGTPPGMLDWIFQVAKKTWATPDIVKDLLTAFDDLLSPQASLCSFGRSGQINPREILRSREALGERVPGFRS